MVAFKDIVWIMSQQPVPAAVLLNAGQAEITTSAAAGDVDLATDVLRNNVRVDPDHPHQTGGTSKDGSIYERRGWTMWIIIPIGRF